MALPIKSDGDELFPSDWNAINVEALMKDGSTVAAALITFSAGIVTPTISSGSGSITVPSGVSTFATLTLAETLVNKTLTAPQIATIVNVGTITLPSATTTLVGRDTTDTLTNKTIGTSNDVTAGKLKVTGGVVEVTSSPIPSNGKALIATGAGAASFQTIPYPVTTASNLGAGSGLFASLSGTTLQFKSLVAGSNVTFSVGANSITINASGGSGTALTVQEVDGAPSVANTTTLQFDQADGFSVTDVGGGVAKVKFTGSGGFNGTATSDLAMQRFSVLNANAYTVNSTGTSFIDNGNPGVATTADLRIGISGSPGTDLRAIFSVVEGDSILEVREAGASVRTGHLWIDGNATSTGAVRFNDHSSDVLTDDTVRVNGGTISLSGANAWGALYQKNGLLYYRAPSNGTVYLVSSSTSGGGFANPATVDLNMARFQILNIKAATFNTGNTSFIDNGVPGTATNGDLRLAVSGNPGTGLRKVNTVVEGTTTLSISEIGTTTFAGHLWLGGTTTTSGALRLNNHSTDILTDNTAASVSGDITVVGLNAWGGVFMKNNQLFFRAPGNGTVYQITPSTAAAAGTYTNATVTVDSTGRISAISSGAGGGGGDNLGNHTATANLNMAGFAINNVTNVRQSTGTSLAYINLVSDLQLASAAGSLVGLYPGGTLSFYASTTEVAVFGKPLNMSSQNINNIGDATLASSSKRFNCNSGFVDNASAIFITERSADPSNAADKGVLYAKDVGGVTQLFYRRSNGSVVQVT